MKTLLAALGLLLAATVSSVPTLVFGPGDVIISSPYYQQQ